MPSSARCALEPVDARYRLPLGQSLLFDWDGCLGAGTEVLPAARDLLRAVAPRAAILSNNSTHLAEDVVTWLARAGVEMPVERIILAGAETVRWAATQRNARVMLLAAPRLRAFARSLGVELVRERPDLVLVLRDARFTYAKLERAVAALAGGARLIASNADRTHPGAFGRLVPETGALLAAIRTCMPEVEPLVIGKPNPALFHMACRALGVAPSEVLMVGDNPDTDVAGARAAGMLALLVGPSSNRSIADLIA